MLSRLTPLAVVTVVALLSVACSGGTGDTPTPNSVVAVPTSAATLHVEIGGGSDFFTPIAERSTITLSSGAQGGQVLWMSVRVKDQGFDSVRVNLSSRFADTGQPAGETSGWIAPLSAPMDGMRTHAGMRNYVTPVNAPRVVILRIEVVAPDGSHGSDERTVSLSP